MTTTIEQLKRNISRKFGFEISDIRQNVLQNAIGERSRSYSFSNVQDYMDWLTADDSSSEWEQMINLLTVKETFFFRNLKQFGYLENSIIPQLIRSKFRWSSRPRLRILSAACSTGEEPYSIAISLLERISNAHQWDIVIDAFDVSSTAIMKAREGLYPETDRFLHSVNSMNSGYLEKYFTSADTAGQRLWQIKPEVQSLIRFQRSNLMDLIQRPEMLLPKYDIIFCRNVMIYFNAFIQSELVSWLERSLEPEGYLLTGDAEGLHMFSHDLTMDNLSHGFVYRKTHCEQKIAI